MNDNITTIVSADNDINVVLDTHFRASQALSGAEILAYSLSNGILPLPIRPGTKRPLISGWSGADQRMRINGETVVLSGKTTSEIFDVWRNGGKDRFLNAPIGWRTGNTYVVNKDDPYITELSGTILIGVDIDSDTWVQPFLDEFQPNAVVRGAKGIKIPLFIKSAPHISGKIQYKDQEGGLAFELLRTNQTQMVMCGQHPKGVPYLWYYNEFPLETPLECYEWDEFNEKIEQVAARMGLTKTSGVDENPDTIVDASHGQLMDFESAWDVGTSWSYRIRQANAHLTDEEFYTKLRMWPVADIHDLTILPDGSVQGSHPIHGSIASGTNYQLNPITGMWRCWKHGSWGDLVDFIGMDMGFISCEELSTITAEERKVNPDKYMQQRQLRYQKLHGFYKIILKGIQHLGLNVPMDLINKTRDETRDVAVDNDGRVRVVDLSQVRDSDYLTEEDMKDIEIGAVIIKGKKKVQKDDRERYARATIKHLYVNGNLDEDKIIERFGAFNATRLDEHFTPEQAIEYVRVIIGGLTEQKKQAALSIPETKRGEIVPGEPEITKEIYDKALTILTNGDPIEFVLKTWNEYHVGDETLGEACILSAASQSVFNSRGIHILANGKPGKGKSDGFEKFIKLLPSEYKISGSFSDKALHYAQINPKTVLYVDDQGISEGMQDTMKTYMTDFREPQPHRTLVKQEFQVKWMPERLTFWFSKVEDVGDEQIADRLLSVWIDDSTEQDRRVFEALAESVSRVPETIKTPENILTCRAIWYILKQDTINITIPYAADIMLADYTNRRNGKLIFEFIYSYALMRCKQPDAITYTKDGAKNINANYEDFRRTQNFFSKINGECGSQITKLSRSEQAILDGLCKIDKPTFTVADVQELMGKGGNYRTALRIIRGRDPKSITANDGLIRKCPAIRVIDASKSMSTEDEDGHRIIRSNRQIVYQFDIGLYHQWNSTSRGVFFWFNPASNTAHEYGKHLSKLDHQNNHPVSPVDEQVIPRRDMGSDNFDVCLNDHIIMGQQQYDNVARSQLIVEVNPDDYKKISPYGVKCNICDNVATYKNDDSSIHLCETCFMKEIGKHNDASGAV